MYSYFFFKGRLEKVANNAFFINYSTDRHIGPVERIMRRSEEGFEDSILFVLEFGQMAYKGQRPRTSLAPPDKNKNKIHKEFNMVAVNICIHQTSSMSMCVT